CQRWRALSGRVSVMATLSPILASFFSSCARKVDVRRWVFPYSGSRTCRSIATFTVLSILSLTTTPVTTALVAIALHRLLLAQHGLHARQVPAQRLQLVGRLELPHRLLDPQPEQLIVELFLALLQLVGPQIPELTALHDGRSSADRVATRVLMGILAAASRIASRASVSVTPSISNRMRPGRTTHPHCSGAPLPLPIRVSCGFFVIGLSGNTRTQILPPREMKRVIATRAASICRSVSHTGSSDLSP